MEENIKHFQFKHPFTCLVAGPTGSGKTVLVRRILKHFNLLLHPEMHTIKVIWAHGQWQNSYNNPIGHNVLVEYTDGLPTGIEIKEKLPQVIVIDDLMAELAKNNDLINLFTKMSHHLRISVIFIVQNLFFQTPIMRTISLNAHYIILLKNPRDKLQVLNLARQLYPGKTLMFMEAYEDAVSQPFSYIKIDLTPDTPDKYRLQTRITPEEVLHLKYKFAPIIYEPKLLIKGI
jgi:hypothetical protein